MIGDEEDEHVVVTAASYKAILKPGGGTCLIVLMQVVMIMFVVCNIGANYTIQLWAYSSPEKQKEKFEFFLAIVLAFSFGMAIFIFLRVGVLMLAQLKTSKFLHNNLITRVFQAPVNLFFDITPIGKILNRFSRDLSVVDEQIFFDFGTILACFYSALSALVVAGFAVPWMLILIVIYIIACVWLFLYAVPGYKDSFRLITVSMSPILSFFQETFSGGSVVRAFRKEEQFEERALHLIDRCAAACLITSGIWCWVSLRLSFLSNLMLAAACAVCVLFRGSVSSIQLSLMLQYLLTLQGWTVYLLIFYGEIERKMVSVQRLLDLREIEQES